MSHPKAGAPEPHGRLLARNTLLNLVGFGAPMLVALVAVPLLVGGLGTDAFGVLALAWMALTYLGELGLGTATTKFAAESLGRDGGGDGGRDVGSIAWTTAGMQAAVGLAEGVALWLATPWLVRGLFNIPQALWADADYCFRVLAVVLPMLAVSKSFMGLLEAAQRFDLVTAVRVPATVGNYLLPLLALALGWGLPGVFTLMLASRLLALVAYFALAVRVFPGAWRPRFHGRDWRRMLGFGGWAAVSTIVSPMLVYLDRFLIGVVVSMAAVAYYAAPYELIWRLSVIPMALVTTLFPAFSQLGGGGDWRRAGRLAARAVKLILLVLAPLVLLLMGAATDALRLWLGAEFAAESALALRILAVGVLVNAAAQVPFVLLQSSGRPDIPARFHLLELPVHALVAWLLVSRWGITGAAAAWSIRVALDAALLFLAGHRLRLLRLEDLRAEKALRAGALAAAGVAVALLPLGVDSGALRLGLVTVIAAAGAAALWRFAMEQADRARVLTLFRPAVTS